MHHANGSHQSQPEAPASYDPTFGDLSLSWRSAMYREAASHLQDPNKTTRDHAQAVTAKLGPEIVHRLAELDVVDLRYPPNR